MQVTEGATGAPPLPPPPSIFQNQGKTWVLPFLPHMAPLLSTYEDVTQVPFLYVVEAELILSLLVQGSFLNCTTENKENTEKIMITY